MFPQLVLHVGPVDPSATYALEMTFLDDGGNRHQLLRSGPTLLDTIILPEMKVPPISSRPSFSSITGVHCSMDASSQRCRPNFEVYQCFTGGFFVRNARNLKRDRRFLGLTLSSRAFVSSRLTTTRPSFIRPLPLNHSRWYFQGIPLWLPVSDHFRSGSLVFVQS